MSSAELAKFYKFADEVLKGRAARSRISSATFTGNELELFISSFRFDASSGFTERRPKRVYVMTREGDLRPARSIHEFLQQLMIEQVALAAALEKLGEEEFKELTEAHELKYGDSTPEVVQLARADGWSFESMDYFLPQFADAVHVPSMGPGKGGVEWGLQYSERKRSALEAAVVFAVLRRKGMPNAVLTDSLLPFVLAGTSIVSFPCAKESLATKLKTNLAHGECETGEAKLSSKRVGGRDHELYTVEWDDDKYGDVALGLVLTTIPNYVSSFTEQWRYAPANGFHLPF